MAVDFQSWISQAEKKQADAKWRKVFRPGCLGMTVLLTMFALFLCNVAINTPRLKQSIAWNAAVFGLSPRNCTKEFWSSSTAEALERADDDDDILQKRIACNESSSPGQARVGTQFLPAGMIESYTDLERRHLWKAPAKDAMEPQNLLAMPVGLEQKETVKKIIKKFPASNFTLMLFHYDGNVDGWADMEWNTRAIHVMAFNQTKWWFAKRFLHPDIVEKYKYIFLWDEDLGVENFDSGRYLDIMEEEGLEISQPALHPSSATHHRLTVLKQDRKAHKRINSFAGKEQCTPESNGPPCTGFVEMMAPVFSRAAWRCVWYMIQNDLVFGWGMDYKLGYCAQGVRSEKVGVIDAEYVVHEGIPSLGGLSNKTASPRKDSSPRKQGTGAGVECDQRCEIRKSSTEEMETYRRRWRRAAANDKSWQDPYARPVVPKIVMTSEKTAAKNSGGPAPVDRVNATKGATQRQQSTPGKKKRN